MFSLLRVLFVLCVLFLCNSSAYACNPFAFLCGGGQSRSCTPTPCTTNSRFATTQTAQYCGQPQYQTVNNSASYVYSNGFVISQPAIHYPQHQQGTVIYQNCANGRCTPVFVGSSPTIQAVGGIAAGASIIPASNAEKVQIVPKVKPEPKLEPK